VGEPDRRIVKCAYQHNVPHEITDECVDVTEVPAPRTAAGSVPTGLWTTADVEAARQLLEDNRYGGPDDTTDLSREDFTEIIEIVLTTTWERAVAEGRRQAAEAVRLSNELIGDGPCQDCGSDNIRWSAESPFWNMVMGGPDSRDDPGGIVCVRCFVVRADAAGYNPDGWRLLADWHWETTAERAARRMREALGG
jgi:hypothetical protein